MKRARRHRLFLEALPAVTLAAVLALVLSFAGCGGAGLIEGTNPSLEVEYVPVRIVVNSDYNVAYQGGEYGADLGKAVEEADLRCEIAFDPAGTGSTPGGVSILQAAQTFPDDCPSPPGAAMCVRCINEHKFLGNDGVTWEYDPTQSHCVGTCEGMVPNPIGGSTDTLPLRFIYYADVATPTASAGTAMIRTDGSAADASYLSDDLLDIHLNTSDDYVLTRCDGSPDPPEMTITLDEPILGAFDSRTVAPDGTIEWTKAFTIADMGQPGQDDLNRCGIDVYIDGGMPLLGNEASSSVTYSVMYCDDMQSCAAFGAGGSLDTGPMEFFDGLMSPLEGLSEAMLRPNFWLSFATGMRDTTLNEDTIVIESPQLGFGLTQPTYTFASVGRQDQADGILNDDFFLTFDENSAYMYQLHDFVMMLWDIASLNNETLDYPMLLEWSSGCAISDEYAKISEICYRPDVNMTNEPFTPTLSDWDSISDPPAQGGEAVLTYNTTTASVLKYADKDKTVGQEQSARIEKLVLPNSKWRVEARLLNMAGFDDADANGYADFIRVGLVDSNYSGYVTGIEGIFDGKNYVPSCFAVRYLNGVVQEGAYVNCDHRSDILLQFSHQSSYSDIVARVSFDGGQSWTDIEATGSLYPGASATNMTYVTQIQDHHAILEGFSAANATANDNIANIERIRWYGIFNSNNALVDQYVDTDFAEVPPS